MKILYVITRSDVLGGASAHLLDLAVGMQKRGHSVRILVGGNGVLHEIAASRGVDVKSLRYLVREIRPTQDVLSIFELIRGIKEYKPDLLHLHSSKAGIIGRIAAAICNVPVVFTAHGWAFTEGVSPAQRIIYRVVEKAMSKFVDKIIAVSEYDKALAVNLRVVAPDRIIAVHNGISSRDVHNYSRAEQSRLAFKFVMVARFEKPKDQVLLIQALSLLKDKNWNLELIGDGPGLLPCIEVAHRMDLADRIQFSGACNDVPTRLLGADAFVLISHWEGLPLTILEAMRSGLPVIASDVGGVGEAVINYETGILVQNTKSSIVNALEKLFSSRQLASQMGASGRARFLKHFTFDKMCSQTLDVYDEVLVAQ